MARGKKEEKVQTTEEWLEQALVPAEEQPYSVPENWIWTKFNAVISLISGRDVELSLCNDQRLGIPYILGASNIQNGSFCAERWIQNPEVKSKKGDILLSVKGTIGKLYFQKEPEINISRQIMAIRPRRDLNALYTKHFLQLICQELREDGNGLIPGISRKDILEKPFPLPPSYEQQRIVDRIESLFAKLDEAKEKAQAVVDGFEARRAAILHKAFMGELTEKWRAYKSCEMSNWQYVAIGDVTDIVSSKRVYKDEYVESGIPFYRSSEIVDLYDTGNTKPIFFISRNRYEDIKAKYGVPDPGDLLVTSVGTIGKTWIADNREFYYKDGNLTQVKHCEKLSMKFLQYFIMSNDFLQQVIDTVAGSAYNALTIVKFKKIILPLPSVCEQNEIIRVLDNLFEKEQQAKEIAEAVLDQIEVMKKSILARAFRGKLGTNDPAEESAVELLKQVL